MAFIWDHNFSREIRELGYDTATQTLVVTFPDRVRRSYAPVTYALYAALRHTRTPARLFREMVAGKVPLVATSRQP
ncbi:MAG TPA: KTSC domain-containing protein [Methanoregulaceae archaeon]|nr:KTSC domain-containing protein [Methanoregulaceae archaeon]HRY76515.1 KTSC domain-containing protein [Methanoregulaceae archaeon]